MNNRIRGYLHGGEGHGRESIRLPEGYDPNRLPPPEPNRHLPIEVGFGREELIALLRRNLDTLLANAAEIDATAPNPAESAAETAAVETAYTALMAWAARHPGPYILMTMYPSSELEVVEDEDLPLG